MFRILKQNGFLIISCFIREGTHGKWAGLHQHDLTTISGDLIHYDKNGKMTNYTSDLDFKCVYENMHDDQVGEWFHIVFQKTS